MYVNLNQYRGVWVIAEVFNGKLAKVSIELIGKGQELATKLGVRLTAVLIGNSVRELANELISYGSDRVLVVDHTALAEYKTSTYTDIVADLVRKEQPEVIIVGATPLGRDLTPRLAARLGTGCTADCTGLDIDKDERLFVSTRPAFGGNVMATIVCPEHRPQMATVRPGAMPMPIKDRSRNGEIVEPPLNFEFIDRVRVLKTERGEDSGVHLEEAERIVAIGMGVEDEEAYGIVKELAKVLNAELGATRLAVEAGRISHEHQVGQTGKSVKPSLYIACGISGALQHTAGMSGSKVVVAINKDPHAEIFKYADYGIVGDVKVVIPPIISVIRSGKDLQ